MVQMKRNIYKIYDEGPNMPTDRTAAQSLFRSLWSQK